MLECECASASALQTQASSSPISNNQCHFPIIAQEITQLF